MKSIVDILVQEIKEELNSVSQLNKKDRMFQIPIQDIGDETLDMLVNYNTRINGIHGTEDTSIETSSKEEFEVEDSCSISFKPLKEQKICDRSNTSNNSENSNVTKKLDSPARTYDKSGNVLAGIGIPNLPFLPQLPQSTINQPIFRKNSLAKILNMSTDSLDLDMNEPIPCDSRYTYIWNSPELTDVDYTPMQNDVNSEYTAFSGVTKFSSPNILPLYNSDNATINKGQKFGQVFHYEPNFFNKNNNNIEDNKYNKNNSNNDNNDDDTLDSYLQNDLETAFEEFGVNIDKDLENLILNLDSIRFDDEELAAHEINEVKQKDEQWDQIENLKNNVLLEKNSFTYRDEKRNSHVESPFKVKSSHKKSKEYIIIDDDDSDIYSGKEIHMENKISFNESLIDYTPNNTDDEIDISLKENSSIGKKIRLTPEEKLSKQTDLIDRGKIYFKFTGLKNLHLTNYKARNTELMIVMVNKLTKDKYTILNWNKINSNKFINIDKDISFNIPNTMTDMSNWQVKIYLRYDRITKNTTESTRKIPLKKKSFFHKTKYTLETIIIDKDVENNDWDKILDSKGQFGLGKFHDTLLNDNKKKFFNITLQNEWSSGRQPYTVATIQLQTQFLPRSSNDEVFPHHLSMIDRIVSKLQYQQNLTMSGYLLQRNGDIANGMLVRRYFKLNGTKLVGYHEMTNTPQIEINLLNVDSITDPNMVNNLRNFTNVTDTILLGDTIQLQFCDGETLKLTCCDNLIEQWHRTIMNVITLNMSHQPWVKKQINE